METLSDIISRQKVVIERHTHLYKALEHEKSSTSTFGTLDIDSASLKEIVAQAPDETKAKVSFRKFKYTK
jgi:hypothetical protein